MTTPRNRSSGFTLIEMLVVVAVLGVIAGVGFPILQETIHRLKIEGFARKTGIFVQSARMEAIKRSAQAVVRFDADAGEMVAFVDVDGPVAGTPSDGLFNQVDGAEFRETDYELGRYKLPAGVTLSAPPDEDVIWGFSTVDGEQVAILTPAGTIEVVGAFRFGDRRGNFLEVRVEPAATARIQVRKWDPASGTWKEQGEGGESWHWS